MKIEKKSDVKRILEWFFGDGDNTALEEASTQIWEGIKEIFKKYEGEILARKIRDSMEEFKGMVRDKLFGEDFWSEF